MGGGFATGGGKGGGTVGVVVDDDAAAAAAANDGTGVVLFSVLGSFCFVHSPSLLGEPEVLDRGVVGAEFTLAAISAASAGTREAIPVTEAFGEVD